MARTEQIEPAGPDQIVALIPRIVKRAQPNFRTLAQAIANEDRTGVFTVLVGSSKCAGAKSGLRNPAVVALPISFFNRGDLMYNALKLTAE